MWNRVSLYQTLCWGHSQHNSEFWVSTGGNHQPLPQDVKTKRASLLYLEKGWKIRVGQHSDWPESLQAHWSQWAVCWELMLPLVDFNPIAQLLGRFAWPLPSVLKIVLTQSPGSGPDGNWVGQPTSSPTSSPTPVLSRSILQHCPRKRGGPLSQMLSLARGKIISSLPGLLPGPPGVGPALLCSHPQAGSPTLPATRASSTMLPIMVKGQLSPECWSQQGMEPALTLSYYCRAMVLDIILWGSMVQDLNLVSGDSTGHSHQAVPYYPGVSISTSLHCLHPIQLLSSHLHPILPSLHQLIWVVPRSHLTMAWWPHWWLMDFKELP